MSGPGMIHELVINICVCKFLVHEKTYDSDSVTCAIRSKEESDMDVGLLPLVVISSCVYLFY